jgi:hypothetical protein
VNLSNCLRIVWPRAKASINRLLGNTPSELRIAHDSAGRPPYEIMEMIIAYIAHDFRTLKAVSLTCRSWYIAAVPHLHHTFPLRIYDGLARLSNLHQLGLMPLVKEIQVWQFCQIPWFTPQTFSHRSLSYFSAFTNVQTLVPGCLDISSFIPGIERYFGHFSPTLRSIALISPTCTPRQLSHFLSLFPNLDDIAIWECHNHPPDGPTFDTGLVPFSTPKLRGRLMLHCSAFVETWTSLIASGGGPQFHYMDLHGVGHCAPVLFEACAETLETLRFYAKGSLIGE